MAHVPARAPEELPELAEVFASSASLMGFVPNSMLTMAHMPQLPMAFSLLASVVMGADLAPAMERYAKCVPAQTQGEGHLSPALVQLIALACSVRAGCRYCQAHTAHNAHRFGANNAQLEAIMAYDTSDAFSAAERAAVGLAFAAASVPNEATASHFEALRAHFNPGQITQIVAVIALFGFLNRWNDTLATQLEDTPVDFAQKTLGGGGWTAGKHFGAG